LGETEALCVKNESQWAIIKYVNKGGTGMAIKKRSNTIECNCLKPNDIISTTPLPDPPLHDRLTIGFHDDRKAATARKIKYFKIKTYGRDSDDGMGDLLAEVSFGSFLHLDQDHGRDFFGGENLLALVRFELDVRLRVLVDHLEGEVLEVMLDRGVAPLAADQALGVEDSVLRVGGQLILGGVTDQTLSLGGEGDVGRGDTVTLVVGDNFNSAVLENSDAAKKKKL
jgi:NAD-specific glutamate dehydrogenase